MGIVYKAKHPTLGRYVLLKRLAVRGGAQFTERFKREATLLMDFKHDAIVQVYDHFKEGSYTYIVEEFIDGISLEALIRRERYLSNEAAMLILYEVARALKYAHDKGVVHRDIKPGNILISNKGEVKLVDFGIATPIEGADDALTHDGMTLGTPAYIPPEQIGDARNADKRADIYSLGVVLYEALTGKTPFPGSFNAETIAAIQKGKYTPAARLNPKISPLLRRIIRKCVRPKRRRRYQDLHHVLRMVGKRIRRREPAAIREAIRKVLKGEGPGNVLRTRGSALAWSLGAVLLLGGLAAAAWQLYDRRLRPRVVPGRPLRRSDSRGARAARLQAGARSRRPRRRLPRAGRRPGADRRLCPRARPGARRAAGLHPRVAQGLPPRGTLPCQARPWTESSRGTRSTSRRARSSARASTP